MKRARSDSPNGDPRSDELAAEVRDTRSESSASRASISEDPSGSGGRVSSAASSSESEESEVDFGVDPQRDPVLPLLIEALAAMQPEETYADTLKRVARTQAGKLDRLTEVHSELLKQQDLVLVSMRREAVLARALAEAARLRTALPPAWLLRWSSTPAVVHGPFPAAEMEAWADGGYFEKKAADVKNVNTPGSGWRAAKDQFPQQGRR